MEKFTFRQMRRIRQQEADDVCKQILKEEKRAALSVIGEGGYPYAVPVNFFYDETDNCIYIHGARRGHKIDAIKACNKVCLTTWNQGFKIEGNWEWNATSVVVFGKARFVGDLELMKDRLRKMATKYYPTLEEVDHEMASPAMNAVQLIAIDIEHMTGKLVNEK